MVLENGRPLPYLTSSAEMIGSATPGRFMANQHVVTFNSTDGTDPRDNGYVYHLSTP